MISDSGQEACPPLHLNIGHNTSFQIVKELRLAFVAGEPAFAESYYARLGLNCYERILLVCLLELSLERNLPPASKIFFSPTCVVYLFAS